MDMASNNAGPKKGAYVPPHLRGASLNPQSVGAASPGPQTPSPPPVQPQAIENNLKPKGKKLLNKRVPTPTQKSSEAGESDNEGTGQAVSKAGAKAPGRAGGQLPSTAARRQSGNSINVQQSPNQPIAPRPVNPVQNRPLNTPPSTQVGPGGNPNIFRNQPIPRSSPGVPAVRPQMPSSSSPLKPGKNNEPGTGDPNTVSLNSVQMNRKGGTPQAPTTFPQGQMPNAQRSNSGSQFPQANQFQGQGGKDGAQNMNLDMSNPQNVAAMQNFLMQNAGNQPGMFPGSMEQMQQMINQQQQQGGQHQMLQNGMNPALGQMLGTNQGSHQNMMGVDQNGRPFNQFGNIPPEQLNLSSSFAPGAAQNAQNMGGMNQNNMQFNQGNNQLPGQGSQSVQQSPTMNMRMPENDDNKLKESKKPGLMNQTIPKAGGMESTPVMMDKIPVNNHMRKDAVDTQKKDNDTLKTGVGTEGNDEMKQDNAMTPSPVEKKPRVKIGNKAMSKSVIRPPPTDTPVTTPMEQKDPAKEESPQPPSPSGRPSVKRTSVVLHQPFEGVDEAKRKAEEQEKEKAGAAVPPAGPATKVPVVNKMFKSRKETQNKPLTSVPDSSTKTTVGNLGSNHNGITTPTTDDNYKKYTETKTQIIQQQRSQQVQQNQQFQVGMPNNNMHTMQNMHGMPQQNIQQLHLMMQNMQGMPMNQMQGMNQIQQRNMQPGAKAGPPDPKAWGPKMPHVSGDKQVLRKEILLAFKFLEEAPPKLKIWGSKEVPQQAAGAASMFADWRNDGQDHRKAKDKKKQKVREPKLEQGHESWAVQQKVAHDEDETVIRKMKAILNKLTDAKFDKLYNDMIACGIKTQYHIEVLMKEVFHKAVNQHHFIPIYTKLCEKLNGWCQELQDVPDFRRILLTQCQVSFENNLKPPDGLLNADVNDEEALEKEIKYKQQMLGNIKFVGELLSVRLLASRVLIQCAQELLNSKGPHGGHSGVSLECLAVLLQVTGKIFDNPEWKYHAALQDCYKAAEQLSNKTQIPPRIRFLFTNIIDLRKNKWTKL